MSRGRFHVARTAVEGIEAVAAESRHSFSRHTHEAYGVGLILSGAQKSASGRGPVEAGAGHVITVNPGEVHDGAPLGNAARRWRMLYMQPSVVAAAARDIFEDRPRAEFHAPVLDDRRIAGHFLAAARALAASEGSPTPGAEERLLILLAALLRERPEGGPRRTAAIAKARARLDDDPAAPVSLHMLAGECGIGRYRLLRDFARETGLTPHAYLLQRRTDLARRLVAAGLPLSQAAATAGFADQSHMTRHFVRRYGYTPGAYAAAFS